MIQELVELVVPKYRRSVYDLEFIRNGETIFECIMENPILDVLKTPSSYDFILFTDVSIDGSTRNKVMYNTPPINYDFECSKINFILSKLYLEDDSGNKIEYNLSFKTDSYNYFIVDNVINQKFMFYFLTRHYPEIEWNTEEPLKYTLEIIDNNINTYNIDEKISLYILKNECREIDS